MPSKHIRTLLIILLLATINTIAAKPKLVVNIVVGQMRYDYLLRFRDNFSEYGFKRFINEGVSCDRAMYNFLTTSTPAGLATLMTGANPSTHGISGTHWFNHTTGEKIELIRDGSFATHGSKELSARVSPKGMIASTLGDGLKSISPQSKVISIGFDPISSVITGGFNADAIYWYSPREGNMLTGGYYQNSLPMWVKQFNDQRRTDTYMANKWTTLLPYDKYNHVFRKDISINGENNTPRLNYNSFQAFPWANSLLKDFAIELVKNEELGRDNYTDLLTIVFDPMRFIGEKYGTQSLEIEDAYYRIDTEIGALIDLIEASIGRENLLVVLTADHGAADPVIESSKMPSGRFNSEQFAMLVHGFVGGVLGAGEKWILDYSNNQIFFNRRLMFERGVDLADIQNKVAAFAVQFTGVAQAITSSALQGSYFSEGIFNKAQNSFNQIRSGDVMINLLPGWSEDNGKTSDCGSPYNYDTHVPLLWYGGMISKQNIARDIDMTDVAPTIAHIMEIVPPNSSTGRPITEIYAKNGL